MVVVIRTITVVNLQIFANGAADTCLPLPGRCASLCAYLVGVAARKISPAFTVVAVV